MSTKRIRKERQIDKVTLALTENEDIGEVDLYQGETLYTMSNQAHFTAPYIASWEGFYVTPNDTKYQINSQDIYTVKMRMRHPLQSIYQDAMNFGEDFEQGDSLLKMSGEFASVNIEINNHQAGEKNNEITFQLKKNTSGRLGCIIISIEADSFKEARSIAMTETQILLSQLSITHNIELDIIATSVTSSDQASFLFSWAHKASEREFNIQIFQHAARTGTQHIIFSLYREAMNSIDPFHKIIAFFRVYEALVSFRSWHRKKHNIQYMGERLPAEHRDLPTEYKNIIHKDMYESIKGKTVNGAIDILRENYRNAVAHGNIENLTDKNKPLHTIDDYVVLGNVREMSTILLYIIRVLTISTFKQTPGYQNLIFAP